MQDELETAVRRASLRFRTHGGGVELAGVAPGGEVTVRFTGMCAGCPGKAACLEHTVRPQVLAVPGVRSVGAPGAAIDAEAAERLGAFLAPAAPGGQR